MGWIDRDSVTPWQGQARVSGGLYIGGTRAQRILQCGGQKIEESFDAVAKRLPRLIVGGKAQGHLQSFDELLHQVRVEMTTVLVIEGTGKI